MFGLDNPRLGLYTLPLLIWHPAQLVMGTLLTPRLAAWVEQELERAAATPAATVDGGADQRGVAAAGVSSGGSSEGGASDVQRRVDGEVVADATSIEMGQVGRGGLTAEQAPDNSALAAPGARALAGLTSDAVDQLNTDRTISDFSEGTTFSPIHASNSEK